MEIPLIKTEPWVAAVAVGLRGRLWESVYIYSQVMQTGLSDWEPNTVPCAMNLCLIHKHVSLSPIFYSF